MKKIIVLTLLAVAVGGVVGVRYVINDEPEYIRSAEIRVGSYLTSDYGGVDCTSKKVNDVRWELDCTHQARGKTFQFAVYPSEKAPYGVARSFYLEAINDDARQSAEQGLMRYLEINTHAG
ncbi:Lipoprotein [Enterobacter asburiae]|uniref:hypothetical protein n=1 Tax=Enterobacter TaxID=547 RepID=UPI0003BE20B3|nr:MULTISPECIES: hypothetical protein [Enterobacter]MCK6786143.1 hypothetical protein [Enterobacter roggenkampii]ESN13242.1 hypothetical protein L370_03519 [Enterobacter sp. MGH 24]KFA82439.1 hypothetical protein N037_13265 [Enterobacter sp. EGD-HP1]MCK7356007.1 hypothetical protein [Enterobacter roggenkampii]MCM7834059.1 hypothetical protein [Enterobacter asburiae]